MCSAIKQLEQEAIQKIKDDCSFNSPEESRNMAHLVGKKCNIMGMIEGQETEVLWDTGSQIALISEKWMRQRFKDTKEVKPLEDVLGYQLSIEAAGGSRIPYEGYVLLKFNWWEARNYDSVLSDKS